MGKVLSIVLLVIVALARIGGILAEGVREAPEPRDAPETVDEEPCAGHI